MEINLKQIESKINEAINKEGFKKDRGISQWGKINLIIDDKSRSSIATKTISEPVGWTQLQIDGWVTGLKTFLLSELQDYFGPGTKFDKLSPSELLTHKQITIRKSSDTGHGNKIIIYEATIELKFTRKAVHRNSFNRKDYQGGVDNILKLLSKGFDYSHKFHGNAINPYMRGTWRGIKNVPAVTKNQDDVLKRLIEEYNSIHRIQGITATLDPSYY